MELYNQSRLRSYSNNNPQFFLETSSKFNQTQKKNFTEFQCNLSTKKRLLRAESLPGNNSFLKKIEESLFKKNKKLNSSIHESKLLKEKIFKKQRLASSPKPVQLQLSNKLNELKLFYQSIYFQNEVLKNMILNKSNELHVAKRILQSFNLQHSNLLAKLKNLKVSLAIPIHFQPVQHKEIEELQSNLDKLFLEAQQKMQFQSIIKKQQQRLKVLLDASQQQQKQNKRLKRDNQNQKLQQQLSQLEEERKNYQRILLQESKILSQLKVDNPHKLIDFNKFYEETLVAQRIALVEKTRQKQALRARLRSVERKRQNLLTKQQGLKKRTVKKTIVELQKKGIEQRISAREIQWASMANNIQSILQGLKSSLQFSEGQLSVISQFERSLM